MTESYFTPEECFLDAVRIFVRQSEGDVPISLDADSLESNGSGFTVYGSDDRFQYRFFVSGDRICMERVTGKKRRKNRKWEGQDYE